MNNKVNVPNPKYQKTKIAMLILFMLALLFVMPLFSFRATATRNYNGRVKEVWGMVENINETDDGVEITLSDGVTYSANRIRTCYPDFDFTILKYENVTFYLPEEQVGGDSIPAWILGIKKADETLIDYEEVIADGKAETKIGMIISGTLAGLFGAVGICIFAWRTRIAPSTEKSLYEEYC